MRTTRRAYLATVGGALAASAGCLGGSGSAATEDCDVGQLEQVDSLPRPTLGAEDAAVTVDVYEDFACSHCATYHLDVFPNVKEEFIDPGDIHYRFFDFPLPVSEQWSWGGAIASRAVQDRTDDETFFEYASSLFEQQGDLTSDGYSVVRDTAEEYDVDGCEVATSVEQDTYRPVVESDRQRAVGEGYDGTPTVVVNGQQLGGYGWNTVRTEIEAHLDSAES